MTMWMPRKEKRALKSSTIMIMKKHTRHLEERTESNKEEPIVKRARRQSLKKC